MTPKARPANWAEILAGDMLDACCRDGQAVRRVESDRDAVVLRKALRDLSRPGVMRIRTAKIADTDAVVRTDAAIWDDNAPDDADQAAATAGLAAR